MSLPIQFLVVMLIGIIVALFAGLAAGMLIVG